MIIKAVLFDFIGTTVLEKGDAINNSFENAFHHNRAPWQPELLKKYRGRDKKEIIELMLAGLQGDKVSLSKKIYDSFKSNVESSLEQFVLNDGIGNLLHYLRKREIKTGIGSALPRDLFEKIFNQLPWEKNNFDYIGIAEEVGRSRPYPDMIFDMMKKTGATNPAEFLKVGDTVADIAEGRNANVMTAAILTGTQSESMLLEARPDFIIASLGELMTLI